MENYGNDLFLSQEGCPSLDFTLLDRPSSSVVSAPGATAPLFPGENSFPSFDIFDGAGVESFDDRLFPGHRSYTSEAQKGAMRRSASTHPGLVQKQMHGVHDFFGQDNQQQHMGSSSWSGMGSGGSHFQSQYFLSGVGNAEDLSGGNMPMKDTLWSNTQSSPSGMPAGDGGFASIQASKPVDDKRFPSEAGGTSVASQVRNPPGGALQYPSDSHNSSSKFGNSLSTNNGMLEHQSTSKDTAIQNAPYQNQYGRYASQTPAGAPVNEAPRLDFLANQIRPAQAAHEPQVGGPPRGGGMTELQLLRQQALQSKHEQALQSKQQQALRLQQQEALRKQEAMRVQQQEALRVQQQEAVQLQQQEAVRMQQQEVMRTQQQEGMQLQQQEMMRMQQQRLQQQEGVRLKQQEAMRKQQQEAMRLQQHETMRAQQQVSMQSQQYEAMWSRHHDAMQSQQQDGTRPQSQDVTMPCQQQDAAHWQQHEVMRSQQQALWSRKQQAMWSQQEQVLESEQKQSMQSQQQNAWLSQQQEAWQQQPQQQQVLPSQQQQALRSALQSTWQTQQQQALRSQQQQPLQPPQQQALNSQQQQALRLQQQQQQALRTQQQQQALRTQQQQALQFQQQQALQIQQQQQQALQSQQQQAPPFQQHPPSQTRHQLQEFFVGQQLNQQLEHSGPQHTPQEACTEFPGTSYSALLHGPDTPPSEPQLGEEPVLSELEDQTAAFPSASTQNFVWPIDGSSYYQGTSKDPSMAQNLVEPHNLHSGSSPAEVTFHPRADGSFPLVQNVETQNILPEYQSGLMSSSIGKPMFQADKMNESSIEPRNKHQVHAKSLVQSSQYGGEQLVHGLDNDPHQINLLSQSQQHFQGLQHSQPRSWESLPQKQDASKPSFSEAMHSLSQSTSMPERNPSQSGTQQNLSSLGARSRSSGNDSYQSGRIHTDNAAGFMQHQRFTTAVGEAPTRINMDEDNGKRSNSWSAMQPHQIGQNAAYYSHQISDAKHDIWGNKAPQHATHMVQNSFSAVSPSDSTQGVFNNIRSTPLEGRVPPMKIAGRSFLFNQESSKLNQESGWKENDRTAVSEQTTLSLSESDRFSHGFWKKHASLQESVGGLDTMCEPLKKVGSGSIWNHSFQQEKLALEAQLDARAASSIPNSTSGPGNAGQGTHGTRFLGREGVSQQIQKQSDRASSHHFASSVNAFSGGTATMVSNDNDNSQIHQGSLVDEQRLSQQHMDPNATNVSLAHLRHSRPSSPLSPQHVKLGLGPSNLPQNIQQVGSAGMRMSPLRDGLVRKGPTSNLEGKKFYAAPPYAGSVHESSVKNKAEFNQGISAQLNGMLLQNNGRPSSALSNSSSFSKESAESETLAPSSFPSAHPERSRVSQGSMKSGGNSLCGTEHLQTGSLDDEPLASLHGKLTAVSESSRQPFHSAGDSEGKLSTGYQQANNDSSSLRVLQNQQIINMALKQLGNRAQTANLAGLLTTLKTSLSEHSKSSGGQEKLFPGILESDRPQSSSTQTGGYAGGNATPSMQRPQMISRKPSTGLEDGSPPKLRAGSQSVSVEHNNQEKQSSHTSEASGSASTSLLADLQRQRRQSLSLMNGNRSHSLHSGGQCEDEVEFTGSQTSNLVPSQADSQMRGADTSFALSGQSQYLQQQRSIILEGSTLHQTFKEPTPGAAWAATLPNLAVKAIGKPNEALLKSLDGSPIHGYLPKVSLGQQDADALAGKQKYKSLMHLKEIQQQNALDSEYLSQRGLQLPKHVAKSVVNAVALTHTDKSADLVLESDVEALHKIRLHSGNSNDQVLPSQELRHDNSSAHGKLITSSHSSLVNKQAQPGDRDTHVSLGKEDPDFKVEEAKPGIKGNIAASNQLSQHQVSPSKTSSHGVVAVHPKKRKKPVPLLIPWHIAASQPRNSLPSTSDAELTWANAANRLPDKDDSDVHKDNVSSGFRAKRRLKLSTQLMQQLIPPLSSRLMHGTSLVDNECTTYSLAKLALEDACRLMANTQREASSAHDSSENKNMPLRGQQGRTWGMAKNVAVMRCVESFVERAKRLDSELARVNSSTSASELRGKIYDLERMAIVNRLARHHGTGLTVDSSEICLIENIPDVGTGIRKPSPKKYVTAAPMPRTLPGVKCLSL